MVKPFIRYLGVAAFVVSMIAAAVAYLAGNPVEGNQHLIIAGIVYLIWWGV